MIAVTGLRKRFGALPVLDGIDLAIHRGRVTAIVGPNGSGKTTLIKTLLGLVRPDAGEVSIDGRVLNGDDEYRAHIGYVPQTARFPENLTPRELVRMLTDLRGARRDPDPVMVAEFGLTAEMDKPVRVLSGGNRQKVSALAAFLFDPALLILDEPTAGLDPVASSALKDRILRRRAEGTTFVLTSHVMADLEELADDVVLLLQGRVQYAGPLQQLCVVTGERRLERAVASLMLEGARGVGARAAAADDTAQEAIVACA